MRTCFTLSIVALAACADKGGRGANATDSASENLPPVESCPPFDNSPPTDTSPPVDTADSADSAAPIDTGLGFDTASPAPPCLTNLGEAGHYNLYSLTDYTGGVDVAGRIATADDLSMTGFILGASAAEDPVAAVGGDLALQTGTVHGPILVDGAITLAGDVTFTRGAATASTGLDFPSLRFQLRRLSAGLATEPTNGSATLTAWGELQLEGLDPTLNIIAADGADLAVASSVTVAAPAGSTVLINIRGASDLSNFSPSFTGVGPEAVLFNPYDATRLRLTDLGWQGAILAPLADVAFNNGEMAGTLIGLRVQGEGHLTPLAFTGVLPCH